MNDLIEALEIFKKYVPDQNSYEFKNPFHCEHDILIVTAVAVEDVSEEDVERLDDLGFFKSEEYDSFASFKFGSS
jgi:hypothetical protein